MINEGQPSDNRPKYAAITYRTSIDPPLSLSLYPRWGSSEIKEGSTTISMVEMADLLMSDEVLATFVPIAVYWVASGIYTLLGRVKRYRLHTQEEEDSKNLVTRRQVIIGVLLQQALQASVALFFGWLAHDPGAAARAAALSYLAVGRQFFTAMLVFDAWQFLMHRLMHHNKFLYRTLHARHHRLVVPYAYGAQYNHPVDGLLIETLSAGLAYAVSGMAPRAGMLFFSLSVVKAVDDHCGLYIPWNPIHLLFRNNAAYHDVHHQLAGAKYNHAQAFFVVWDQIFGTYMPYKLVKRADGGYRMVTALEKQA